ncbi:hypothetical protein HanIR_Chr04g0198631 [Helianthus annuus]|nr:hypothetical protein HanIR_Chr04g0198631 [Helianthus annuus]
MACPFTKSAAMSILHLKNKVLVKTTVHGRPLLRHAARHPSDKLKRAAAHGVPSSDTSYATRPTSSNARRRMVCTSSDTPYATRPTSSNARRRMVCASSDTPCASSKLCRMNTNARRRVAYSPLLLFESNTSTATVPPEISAATVLHPHR